MKQRQSRGLFSSSPIKDLSSQLVSLEKALSSKEFTDAENIADKIYRSAETLSEQADQKFLFPVNTILNTTHKLIITALGEIKDKHQEATNDSDDFVVDWWRGLDELVLYRYALNCMSLGRDLEAFSSLMNIKSYDAVPRYLVNFQLGQLHKRAQEYSQALHHFSEFVAEFVSEFPHSMTELLASAHLNVAQILVAQHKEEHALHHLLLLSDNPEEKLSKIRCAALLELGIVYTHQGEYVKAISTFDALKPFLLAQPATEQRLWALEYYSFCQYSIGDNDAAIQALNEAGQLDNLTDPVKGEIQAALGACFYVKGELDKAKAHFSQSAASFAKMDRTAESVDSIFLVLKLWFERLKSQDILPECDELKRLCEIIEKDEGAMVEIGDEPLTIHP